MNLEFKMLTKKFEMLAYSCVLVEQKLSWLWVWNEYVVLKEPKKILKLDFSYFQFNK